MGGDKSTNGIDLNELRDLLAEISIEGNEQYKANLPKNADRPYRRGMGAGLSKACDEIAEYFDISLAYAENRKLRSESSQSEVDQ